MSTHNVAIIFCFISLAAYIGPMAAAETAAIADKVSYFGDISTELKKVWPGNSVVNIVCHGHSVPAGYFKTPVVDTFNAYPHLFHVGLKELYLHPQGRDALI